MREARDIKSFPADASTPLGSGLDGHGLAQPWLAPLSPRVPMATVLDCLDPWLANCRRKLKLSKYPAMTCCVSTGASLRFVSLRLLQRSRPVSCCGLMMFSFVQHSQVSSCPNHPALFPRPVTPSQFHFFFPFVFSTPSCFPSSYFTVASGVLTVQ